MKKIVFAVLAVAMSASAMGCAYGGVSGVGADKVVITRNDAFLFGILRAVYVCKVADSGVSSCQASEAP